MKNIFSSSKPEPVPALASIVAYKLDDKLVYVPLALTFEASLTSSHCADRFLMFFVGRDKSRSPKFPRANRYISLTDNIHCGCQDLWGEDESTDIAGGVQGIPPPVPHARDHVHHHPRPLASP